MNKVMIVEDDLRLSRLIADFLEQHGYAVSTEHRGDTAVAAVKRVKPDVVVLDMMLPGKDGLQICRDLREWSNLPVLMLTAREEDIDQILGLEAGADDYVIKPVEPRVLLARIRALMRRQHAPAGSPDKLQFGALTIDSGTRLVTLDGEEVDTGTAEFELLWLLATSAGKVLSRDAILTALRGVDYDGIDRSVDVGVSKLRKKLGDDPREPRRIKTVWGKGYLFSRDEWES
ncbi:response regulator [Jeongeupia chitinilytica]|uniref:DNA-binding response regulator n=1 Tax=Jeongeupia chitinilytica TaxID=1041641 RepID=A0ABQ3GVL3_9NEIS|nr:response regulator [Jeongeupia chitinilytica]GHD56466.1 DNA-binding response regulator [Jeongeupia chitinilytica]